MKGMSLIVAVVAACVLLAALVYVQIGKQASSVLSEPPQKTIQVNEENVRVSIASTPLERAKGLGGRTGLAQDEGMLFVFPADGEYAFWMKDMQFSIDIIWLSADGTIVDLVQDLSPATYPKAFEPKSVSRYVLEVSAGYAVAHNLHVGDIVRL
jgi:hypothetical protein